MSESTELIVLRRLRAASKVVEKRLMTGSDITPDEMAAFVNAIIESNGVPLIDGDAREGYLS